MRHSGMLLAGIQKNTGCRIGPAPDNDPGSGMTGLVYLIANLVPYF